MSDDNATGGTPKPRGSVGVLRVEDFASDPTPFVDVRIAESIGKESYSFVGAGVTQGGVASSQLGNSSGFNVGAARLPAGKVNNAHLHYTAEVFAVTRGHFEFTIGVGPDAVTIDAGPGDILSIPTWVFRSFRNPSASEDAWAYTFLGRDETGGVVWAPDVLALAAETGLWLDASQRVIEAPAGSSPDVETIHPLDDTDLASLRPVTEADLRRCLVGIDDVVWHDAATLPSCLPDHGTSLAPLIGLGMNADRYAHPPLASHGVGFSLEWLTIDPGCSTGVHAVEESQVAIVISGDVTTERHGDTKISSEHAPAGSVVNLPGADWRSIHNPGDVPARLLVATTGVDRATVEWSSDLVASALEKNVAIDANGCVAPAHVLNGSRRP